VTDLQVRDMAIILLSLIFALLTMASILRTRELEANRAGIVIAMVWVVEVTLLAWVIYAI